MAAVRIGWIEIPVALNPWAIRSQTAWLIRPDLPMDSKRHGFKPGRAPKAHTVVGCSDRFGGLGDLSITAKMKAEMFPTLEIFLSTIFLSKRGFGTGNLGQENFRTRSRRVRPVALFCDLRFPSVSSGCARHLRVLRGRRVSTPIAFRGIGLGDWVPIEEGERLTVRERER